MRSAFIWKRSSRWRRWAATRRRRIWHAAAAPWAACIMPLSRAAQALPTARCARQSEVSKLISALPDTEDTGACICDFETFKEIYRVQRGVQVRYGLQVFLAILTVAPSQNTDAAETALMVEQLGDLIHTNLRQCDVAASYTDMQYVVMLSGSTAESGTGPLERIKAAFYRIPAHGRYLLSYSLYVPEAKADSGRVRRRKKTAKKEK